MKPGQMINRAGRLFARVGEARLRTLGLGVAQLPVFAALKGGVALSQKQLTEFARIEQPSMAQTLARMERDGLVTRSPDPADGRVSLYALTQLAVDKMPQAREMLLQGNQEALQSFTSEEEALLVALLQRVVDNLEQVVV